MGMDILWVFYEYGQMYPILWVWTNVPSLWYFHCYKNPVYSACSPLPGNHSVVLLLIGYQIVGIIHYVTFSDWLLSFNNMHVKKIMHVSLLHTFSRLENSFIFSTE